jgi:hypothetical protein
MKHRHGVHPFTAEPRHGRSAPLHAGPVHLLNRNSPAAVVLTEAESSCLDWLLALPPAPTARSKQEIDAELRQERDW